MLGNPSLLEAVEVPAPSIDNTAGVLPMPGEVLAEKYEVVRELGRGGMAVVYLVMHLPLQRERALKVILPKFAMNPAVSQRFVREARAASGLTTREDFVCIHDLLVFDGLAGIEMEYLGDWSPLDGALKEANRFALGDAVEILQGVLIALAHVHAVGLVHRDIKPSNIFVRRVAGRWRVKVGDLGIVKLQDWGEGARLAEGSAKLTATGMLIGTLEYMSPEALQASEVAMFHRDLWAAAVVLWELLTGAPPVEGTIGKMIQAFDANSMEALDIRLPRPELPAAMTEFFHRAWAKDLTARFESATAMAEALEEASQAPVPEPPPAPVPGPLPAPVWPRRVAVVVLVAALAAVLALLWTFHRASLRRQEPAPVARVERPVPVATPPPPPTVAPTLEGMVCFSEGSMHLGDSEAELARQRLACEGLRRRGCDPARIARLPSERLVHLAAFCLDRREVTRSAFAAWLAEERASGRLVRSRDGRWLLVSDRKVLALDAAEPGLAFVDGAIVAPVGEIGALPVVDVTWDGASLFCEARGSGARLPTEAEWLRALRVPGRPPQRFPWGGADADCARATHARRPGQQCADAGVGPLPTASVAADQTRDGVFDLAGGVSEWVLDEATDVNLSPGRGARPPQGPGAEAGARRLVLGGNWAQPFLLRAGMHINHAQDSAWIDVGFRCAVDAPGR